ncbi:hypothetical protein DOTSEDRAFT_38411 [Dothistroma septosporum NZE10]|uniref:Uncharacterized protein n=1 Tax=Dothistroma septosporum (strain NZE10 / CBS 128990) TaxID=675120 RepID=M2YJU9_DOTSN|nr:hypothetical protein DOTSEDRAFT_38411 [Dothistroma septosporum NZE10]
MGNTICVPLDLTALAWSLACAENKPDLAHLVTITQLDYIGLQAQNSLPSGTNEEPSWCLRSLSLPRLYDPPRVVHTDIRKQMTMMSGLKDNQIRISRSETYQADDWLSEGCILVRSHQAVGKLPDQSRIVESNILRNIGGIEKPVDPDVDCVPCVTGNGFDPGRAPAPTDPNPFQMQSGVFLGRRSHSLSMILSAHHHRRKAGIQEALRRHNVFSFIDHFACTAGDGDDQHLDTATVSYFVLGWHPNSKDSPLPNSGALLNDRLRNLFLELKAMHDEAKDFTDCVASALGSDQAFDVPCHGAMYEIKYDVGGKPIKSRDDAAAENLSGSTNVEPVSVETTALDGILTFLQAHNDENDVFGKDAQKFADDVVDLAALLYAADDTYDSRVRAHLLCTNNFVQNVRGGEWHFDRKSGSNSPPATPDHNQKILPDVLNERQTKFDASSQKLSDLRW